MTTEQEEFWAGPEGAAYAARQTLALQARQHMYASIFNRMQQRPKSIIEFGAGMGDNLVAIRRYGVGMKLAAVEVNEGALERLRLVADAAYLSTIQTFHIEPFWEMAMTRGVLIHIPPNDLPAAYDTLHTQAKRWILIAEYYSPKPRMIPYRGCDNLLWARDFAGEMLDAYADLKLIDYGFIYHRGPNAQDDLTYFLMERT